MIEERSVPGDASPRRPKKLEAGPRQPRSALIAFSCLLVGAAAAMSLAGRAEQGNLGVFLLCAGAAMISCPPLVRVKPATAVMAAAFLLCSAAALLPARFFPAPMWRRAFADAPGLLLPGTVSAAPENTVFWLAVLAVTVLTGLFILTQPVRSKGLSSLALAGAGVCGVYAALSMLAKLPGGASPSPHTETFGFFPNRNHTATLLITGSILSMGILGAAFRVRSRWTANVAVGTLAACVAGLLFFSESRGGVVFLLVGVVGWVAGLGAYRERALLVAVALALLAAGGLFLTLKLGARDRLFGSVPVVTGAAREGTSGESTSPESMRDHDIPAEDRLVIYHDTVGMIRDVPYTGTGLGTFSLVFAPYRQTSASASIVLHPESDWLMVAAETGLPALGCLGVLFVAVWRGWQPARDHPYWPLRWGCMAAAGAALLHGCVDVPIHRAALGWWVLVLAGLALQPGRVPEEGHGVGKSGRAARTIFVLSGLLAAWLGGLLVRAEWFGGPALPPFAAAEAQKEVVAAFKRGDLEGAIERARAAVKASPLAQPLYYQLGLLLIRVEDTDSEIDHAFQLQRQLNPWSPLTPRLQAVVWMPLDPARSAPLFVEALERQERLWRMSRTESTPLRYWREIVQQTDAFPLVQDRLWEACASRDPEYTLTWLENANTHSVKERLPQIAGDDGFLARLSAEQRQRFVTAWKAKGDPEELRVFLQSHGAGWPPL